MVDPKIYGFWEYEVVSFPYPEPNNFFKETINTMLNSRWQIHGTPFVMGDHLCQVLVRFTPPEQPPAAEPASEVPA